MSRVEQTGADRFKTNILLLAATGLIAGLAFYFAGNPDIANLIWVAGVVPALATLVVEILRSIGRGEVGLDIVAALSMTAALVFGETLAAAVVAGHVEGRKVIVGGDGFVASRVGRLSGDHPAMAAGSVLVAVAVDGHMAGHLVMSDPLRDGAGAMLDGLRHEGIGRILLATDDRADLAERVTEGLGLDGLRAGLTPDQKVLLVLTERKHGPVMMVGDGVNDAPALAAADVGVAMGARGAGLGGGGRRFALGRPDRPAWPGDRDRACLATDRRRKRHRRDRPFGPRHDRRRLRPPHAGAGRAPAGVHRRRGDVAVILNALRALRIAPHEPATPKPQAVSSGQADIPEGATP